MTTRHPVSRKINREAVVVLGWGRAILLQLAHPLVAAGVAAGTDFHQGAGGYFKRVHHTVGAMLSLAFGSEEEARAVIDRINDIHRRVRGTLPEAVGPFPAGTPYSAQDPVLLCWVHATLIESVVLTYEQLVGDLTPEEKTEYVREAGDVALALGVTPDILPMSYPALEAWLASRYASGEISVGGQARTLADALLSPPFGPAAPVFRVSRLLTTGALPDDIRRGYGYPWDDRRERAYRRALAWTRRVRGALPAVLREWPAARAA
jgi:uncharacterized protein (DUF2236 family)